MVLRRPLALVLWLALVASVLSSGCSISKQVSGAIADSNAALLDSEYFRLPVSKEDAAELDAVDNALIEMERAIQTPEVSASTKAALRMRQAMLCIASKRTVLAGTYFEKVEAGDLSPRDAKLFKARGYLVWWFAKGDNPAIANVERESATKYIELLDQIADGRDDVDFYLAYSATSLATALVKTANQPAILDAAKGAVAHHLTRFDNAKAVVDFVLTKQLTGADLKDKLPPRDVVHWVEASKVLDRMKEALKEEGAKLATPSAPPATELDRLLMYLNQP